MIKRCSTDPASRVARDKQMLSRALLAAITLVATGAAHATTLDSISPERQRVHEMVVLRGADFGTFSPGVSKVVFETPDQTVRIEARRPYLWRDDYIKIRVPVGDGANKMPRLELNVSVEGTEGNSGVLPFQLISFKSGALSFSERSRIVSDEDVSGYLGTIDRNKARTKDADFADVNADGYPDLIDNNSNNSGNNTHSVLRINNGGAGFTDFDWEPISAGDNGQFVVTIPNGGNYVGNSIVYDADFIDLNNDDLPDWVQAESGANLRLRVVMNNNQGVPGNFIEATDTWLPNQNAPGSPDDVCSTDVNYDGFVDIATSYRFSRSIDVFLNNNGQSFGSSVRVDGEGSVSMHDVFFIDANDDGYPDVIGVNENSSSQLFLHNGNLPVPAFVHETNFTDDAHAGIAADLNGDGLEDFALSEFSKAAVYINNPANPGTFTRFTLPNAKDFVYDLEAGDVDLDGDVDLIGASVILGGNEEDSARIWINSGNGTSWSTWPDSRDILPGIAPYQRLSADLVDVDLDGDLDLYLTGSDGSGPWGFGMSPNQFWENDRLSMKLDISGACPGPATIAMTAASPNSRIAVLGSDTLGQTALPAPCAGAAIDLVSPSVLLVTTVDSNGELTLSPNVPEGFCDFVLQVVEISECGVSNVVPLP